MKNIPLVILIFMMSLSNCFAGNKVFYDPISGKEIIDVSGNKTKEQIKKEFNLTQVEEVTLGKDEGHRIKNGTIEKYGHKAENDAIKAQKEANRQEKEDSIKQKLGLTNKEFQDLKEALQK